MIIGQSDILNHVTMYVSLSTGLGRLLFFKGNHGVGEIGEDVVVHKVSITNKKAREG